ncbi:unnamed protein product [Ostreobium quekettii]|uniref:Uncharacterized protein n=1 Tax=Ostreobium quekettii TaxID=121088 RepID=A0A8S1IQ25_9CHLO|nr:unnamed protein product [Ostreobium quekettii]
MPGRHNPRSSSCCHCELSCMGAVVLLEKGMLVRKWNVALSIQGTDMRAVRGLGQVISSAKVFEQRVCTMLAIWAIFHIWANSIIAWVIGAHFEALVVLLLILDSDAV